jgi:regulator of protease activity HflC (stomatin/prohibitin superfamily)
MTNVVDFRTHQMISRIDGLMKQQRQSVQTVYDLVVPQGFRTRMKTPIGKMSLDQLDKLNEQMYDWLMEAS